MTTEAISLAARARHPLTRRGVILSAPLVSLMASGCAIGGGSGGSSTAPEAAGKSRAPVKLRFSSWGTRQWGHEEIIEKFKAKHPHVTEVQIEDGGQFLDYRIKLLNQIAGDDLADVPTVGGQWYLEMVNTSAFLKLENYIQTEQKRRADFYLPKVPAPIMEKGKIQGTLSGLPYLADSAILYVNESLFRERGQALPPTDWSDARWTWDAALERAKALTNPSAPGGATFGFTVNDTLLSDWASVVYQRGGDVLTLDRRGYAFDRPEAYEPLQWRADLRLRHRVVPTAEEARGGAGFDTGRTAMTVGWSSGAQARQERNLPFEWNVYPLPRWQKQISYFHNAWAPIAKRSQAPDAAWSSPPSSPALREPACSVHSFPKATGRRTDPSPTTRSSTSRPAPPCMCPSGRTCRTQSMTCSTRKSCPARVQRGSRSLRCVRPSKRWSRRRGVGTSRFIGAGLAPHSGRPQCSLAER